MPASPHTNADNHCSLAAYLNMTKISTENMFPVRDYSYKQIFSIFIMTPSLQIITKRKSNRRQSIRMHVHVHCVHFHTPYMWFNSHQPRHSTSKTDVHVDSCTIAQDKKCRNNVKQAYKLVFLATKCSREVAD